MTTRIRPNHPNSNLEPNFKLNTNEYLKQCDPRDVVSFNSEKWVNIKKLKQFIQESFSLYAIAEIITCISDHSDLNNVSAWFSQGEQCEILRAGSKGWQKGKIKVNVTLEFIPDKPKETSPLDDVRQELERDNS